jgi:aspartate racemase
MEYGFFQKVFQTYGIATVVPDTVQRNYVDHTIWEKLSHGQATREDREKHKAIIKGLVNRGAEGVILGCTELPSLIRPEDSNVPLFDTTHIHALAILEYAWEKRNNKLRGMR